MSDHWYYLDTNQQPQGPLTTSELQQAMAAGKLSPATRVNRAGASEWVDASSVEAVAARAPGVPAASAPSSGLPIALIVGVLGSAAALLLIVLVYVAVSGGDEVSEVSEPAQVAEARQPESPRNPKPAPTPKPSKLLNDVCMATMVELAKSCNEFGKRLVEPGRKIACSASSSPQPENELGEGFFISVTGAEPQGVKPNLYIPRWFVAKGGQLLADNGQASAACKQLQTTAAVRSERRAAAQDKTGKCTPEDLRIARALFDTLAASPDSDEDLVVKRVASKLGVKTKEVDDAFIKVQAYCADQLHVR